MPSSGKGYELEVFILRSLSSVPADPRDRRGILVRLTEEGRKSIDAAVESHVQVEQELLKGLSEVKRKDLAELLKVLAEAHGL